MSCFHISKYSETRPISDGLRENNVNYYSSLNRYLKRIAEICRIKRNWVFHAARHTYATEIISSGSRTGILPGITPM